jgi:hypothetical protein
MTWLQNCGYDDKEREQIWDAFAAYNQQRPTGMPFNKQALQWHIENTFDEHAAEAVIGWHAISRSVVQTASQRLRERLLAYGAIAFVAVAAGWRGADAPRDDP